MSSIQAYNNLTPEVINGDVQTLDSIKTIKSQREQLKKVSTEFEAIFVTKMLNTMDKTVSIGDKGGLFGEDNKYLDKFKSFIYSEVGRQIAKSPTSTVGFAKQIYQQMEKSLPKENNITSAQTGNAQASQGIKNKVDKEI